MPRKIRSNKRRAGLDDDAIAWLRGEPCGFFEFKHSDDLQAIWNEHGDTDSMFYKRGMPKPITLEDLEERENAWLGTGKGSEYGGEACFVYKHYTDDEKQTLFAERGDKKRFRWQRGMYRPEAI